MRNSATRPTRSSAEMFGGSVKGTWVREMIVFLALAVWLGARALSDAERRQSLLDRGSDPRTAARAVRYGR